MTDTKIINFGINKSYLKHWGLNEALREIFQNFMDYGDYNINIDDNEIISISNDYKPENLEFLSIGNSTKEDSNSRGKYGEGLKMAMLIFARNNYHIVIKTPTNNIYPTFVNTEIGEVFSIEIQKAFNDKFCIEFYIDTDIFLDYESDIIKEHNIIFSDNYYGHVVNKELGRLYCGGLFVCEIPNLTYSYDINPSFLPLDRDRRTPASFDVNYVCSKINQNYNKLNVKDLSNSDTLYMDKIPSSIKKDIRPRLIGDSIYATYKEKGKTKIIKNDKINSIIRYDSFFQRTIKRLKSFIAEKLGIYVLLLKFKEKHVYGEEAIKDFNIILEKLKLE